MLVHEFYFINPKFEHYEYESLIAFYKKNKANTIKVNDSVILKYLDLFNKLPTISYGFGASEYGLSYYGITIIEHKNILSFTKIIENIDVNIFKNLIDLCDFAYKNDCDIFHSGI